MIPTGSQHIDVDGALARERQWESEQALGPGSCRSGNANFAMVVAQVGAPRYEELVRELIGAH